MSPVKLCAFAHSQMRLSSSFTQRASERTASRHSFLLSTLPTLWVKPWFVLLGYKVRDRQVISWAPAVSKPTSLIIITLCYFALAKSPLNGFGVNCRLAMCVYVCVCVAACEREQEIKGLFIYVKITYAPTCLFAFDSVCMKMNRHIWKKVQDCLTCLWKTYPKVKYTNCLFFFFSVTRSWAPLTPNSVNINCCRVTRISTLVYTLLHLFCKPCLHALVM